MTHRARRAVLIVTTLLAMAPCTVSADTSEPVPGEDAGLYRCKHRTGEVAINFKPDIELKELMTWVVGFTCKNFILDPRVVMTTKKVTVIAPNRMSHGEAYRLFLAALSTMSLTVVPKGNVLRIEDAGAARRDTVPLVKQGVPDDDQVVRYVLRPTYAAPDVLMQALATLKSDVGDVQQIGAMLMLTDYGGNVRDMLALVKLVDVPKGSEGIYTITIEHANAKVVSEKVGGILNMPEGAAPAKPATAAATPAIAPSKVMVDERTNTILLAASEAAFERYRALAKRIDVPLDIEGGQAVHVYRLKNAIAEQLAKTLNDTVGQNPAPQPQQPPRPAAASEAGATIDGKVRVIADAPTNSLIVLASGRDFLALQEVIGSLDQPRPQVYIEALFVDITVEDKLFTDGSLHGATALDQATLLGGVHTTSFNSTSAKSLAATGLVAGLLGSSISVLGLSIPSYGVLFNALADNKRANLLSTPSVIALDNETAKFKIGRSIPYQKGLSFGSASSTDVPFGSANVNLDRADLNLELEVKPHITSDGSVLLELKHDGKDFEQMTDLGPTWALRGVETKVLLKDQQTIVIGGMMQERKHTVASQVPVLGDIPLLGALFRSKTQTTTKSNLLILITPYIIHDHLELEAIKERKLRQHEEFVGSLQAFEMMKYQPKLDPGTKRGLVEEINLAVKQVEDDRKAREALDKAIVIPTGPVEVPQGE